MPAIGDLELHARKRVPAFLALRGRCAKDKDTGLGPGGVMIWELAQDHQAGQADPLLQALKQALATPGMATIQLNNQNIELSFFGLPLGSYCVQWTSNLAAPGWNTLSITNVTGPGGPVQVVDPTAPAAPPYRFYRIKTPP